MNHNFNNYNLNEENVTIQRGEGEFEIRPTSRQFIIAPDQLIINLLFK